MKKIKEMSDWELIEAIQAHPLFKSRFEVSPGKFEVISLNQTDEQQVNGNAQNGIKTQLGTWGHINITAAAAADPVVKLFVLAHETSHIKHRDYISTPLLFDIVQIAIPVSLLLTTFLSLKNEAGIVLSVTLSALSYLIINRYGLALAYRKIELRADKEAAVVLKDLTKNDSIDYSKLLNVFSRETTSTSLSKHPRNDVRLKAIKAILSDRL